MTRGRNRGTGGLWLSLPDRIAEQSRLKRLKGATVSDELLAALPERVRAYILDRRRRGVHPLGTPMPGEEGHHAGDQ